MKNKSGTIFAILVATAVVLAATGCHGAAAPAARVARALPPQSAIPASASDLMQSVVLVTDRGGRVAWYRGAAGGHELVAFDAITDESSRNTDVFVMRPDGSGRYCISCRSAIRDGFIGQPA